MSPQIRPLIAGLAAPGLFWLATSVAIGQHAPAPQGRPTPAPTSPTTYQALLLTSGKVVRGEIIEDAKSGLYCLRGSGGPVVYPRIKVLKAAGSVDELYQFQVNRLPVGDPDERVKLARWCLTERLPAQAREQLEAVKEMCPNDPEVKRMLYNLASTTEERSPVDPALRRTSADMPQNDAPRSLDPSVVGKAKRRFTTLPVIFDLPPAQAVKRTGEFVDYVQPVLKQSCLSCHNEKYQGDFQLVEVKNRRDMLNQDIMRANLDATLKLINPDDPSRSELLSAGLVPHGGNKNAIFRGPNDRSYMILVTWVKSLRPAQAGAPGGNRGTSEPGPRPGYSSPDPAPGDGFASDRAGRSSASAAFPPLSASATPRAGVPPLPYQGNVQNYEENAEFYNSPNDRPEFPTPYVLGGTSPQPKQATAPPKTRSVTGKAGANGIAPSTAPVNPRTAIPAGPNAVVLPPTDNINQLPGMDQPLYPTPPSDTADGTDAAVPKSSPAKKKPKKIDNALLEQMIKNRNGNIPTPPAQTGP